MTDGEKIAAFDALTTALTNQWADGRWSAWGHYLCGREIFGTQIEAIADLVAWAEKMAKRRGKSPPVEE